METKRIVNKCVFKVECYFVELANAQQLLIDHPNSMLFKLDITWLCHLPVYFDVVNCFPSEVEKQMFWVFKHKVGGDSTQEVLLFIRDRDAQFVTDVRER